MSSFRHFYIASEWSNSFKSKASWIWVIPVIYPYSSKWVMWHATATLLLSLLSIIVQWAPVLRSNCWLVSGHFNYENTGGCPYNFVISCLVSAVNPLTAWLTILPSVNLTKTPFSISHTALLRPVVIFAMENCLTIYGYFFCEHSWSR